MSVRPTYNLDKKLSDALERAFLAEGWYRRSGCWAKEAQLTKPFGPSYYIYDSFHIEAFLGCSDLESLPKKILQEERGKDIFGHINWTQVLAAVQGALEDA
jgi:hypothetical protein